jgi:hypothetical protein
MPDSAVATTSKNSELDCIVDSAGAPGWEKAVFGEGYTPQQQSKPPVDIVMVVHPNPDNVGWHTIVCYF